MVFGNHILDLLLFYQLHNFADTSLSHQILFFIADCTMIFQYIFVNMVCRGLLDEISNTEKMADKLFSWTRLIQNALIKYKSQA